VDFHEDAVYTGSDCGAGQQRDKLGLAAAYGVVSVG
jgi:hypothetical protein